MYFSYVFPVGGVSTAAVLRGSCLMDMNGNSGFCFLLKRYSVTCFSLTLTMQRCPEHRWTCVIYGCSNSGGKIQLWREIKYQMHCGVKTNKVKGPERYTTSVSYPSFLLYEHKAVLYSPTSYFKCIIIRVIIIIIIIIIIVWLPRSSYYYIDNNIDQSNDSCSIIMSSAATNFI